MLQKTNVANSNGVIDDYVLERIHYRAKGLAVQFKLTDEEREDYAQDMIVEVLSAIEKHDPSQSDRRTFISRVLDKFVKNAIRTELTRQRRGFEKPVPLDDISEHVALVVNDCQHGELSETDQADMRMDIEEIISRMPPHLQKVCSLLKDYSVAEIAAKLGMNRTAIYRCRDEIRKYFERGGYDLSNFCATDLA